MILTISADCITNNKISIIRRISHIQASQFQPNEGTRSKQYRSWTTRLTVRRRYDSAMVSDTLEL